MTATAMMLGAAEGELLAEAAEWHLLSLLFACPAAPWREQVTQLAREVADPVLRATAEQALTEATEGLYHSIFGPGGPAPAREASYNNSIQLGYLLSELTAYYGSFAYQPATQEPPDHVSVEAGFVGYLRLKQAYALANSDHESAAITAEGAQNFIARHLSSIAAPLAAALAALRVDYLAEASQNLLRRVGPTQSRPAVAAVADLEGCGPCGLQTQSTEP